MLPNRQDGEIDRIHDRYVLRARTIESQEEAVRVFNDPRRSIDAHVHLECAGMHLWCLTGSHQRPKDSD